MRSLLAAVAALAALLCGGRAEAACAALPYTFVNGTIASATQVNANLAALLACANAAAYGPNTTVSGNLAFWNSATGKFLSDTANLLQLSKTTFTAAGGGLTVNTTAGVTQQTIATPIEGGQDYDGVQVALRVPTGSTMKNIEAFGGYVSNQLASTGINQNAVVNYGVITCEVNNCASWGANWGVTAGSSNVIDTQTGRKLLGIELDISAHSASDTIQGIGILGSSLIQPAGATALTVGQLDSQQGTPGAVAQWTAGLVCGDGVIDPNGNGCLSIGALHATGTDVGGQKLLFNYIDGAGVHRSIVGQKVAASSFVWSDTAARGAGATAVGFNMPLIVGAVADSGASQPSHPFEMNYFNGASAAQHYTLGVGSNGDLVLADTGSGHFFTSNNAVLGQLGFTTGSGTYLMSSTTGFTDGAGAQAATMTNGPVAGNPTKWIAINDNGVTRHIPAW